MARTFTPAEPSALNTLAETPGSAGHAVADHGEDRQVRVDLDALDLAFLELALERGARPRARRARLRRRGMAQQIECSELPCEMRMTEMPSSRSAPNRRCAVPGTPIMPAPSTLISAMCSMLVMPFTGSLESGFAQISVPGFCGAKVLRIQIGNAAADGRRHGLRMDDLGAEVRELHGLVVRQRVDDLGVGHAARIGRQHAVDVGPDVDLAARRAARRRSSPRSRCRCGRAWSARRGGREAMKPVMISVPLKSAAHQRRELGARFVPLHGRAQRTPLDDHGLARVDPLHVARAFAARREEFAEQLGGPDLAVAGDQVAHVLRGRARELHRVQDAFDVVTVAVEAGHVELARIGRQQRFGDGGVPRAQRVELAAPGLVLRFGARDEAEQRVGDAAAGRQHHAQPTRRQRFEDVGDALETLGVRDRRTAKFVYDPGGGVSRLH